MGEIEFKPSMTPLGFFIEKLYTSWLRHECSAYP